MLSSICQTHPFLCVKCMVCDIPNLQTRAGGRPNDSDCAQAQQQQVMYHLHVGMSSRCSSLSYSTLRETIVCFAWK